MKKTVSISFIISVLQSIGIAQTYFQQEVNFTINVKLDDVKNEITADERIEYINNSPNDLSFIYMHLWPNAYKDNTSALAKQFLENGVTKLEYAKPADRGYIDQIDFKINDKLAKWELLKDSIDICKLYLNEPLKHGGKVIITTPFHVKIPSGKISRLGHIGQSYQITQWYPKPAVYDLNGWNYMPYLNQGEFYSEFGSFDVSITLPKNYVLGATGDMIDGEKELEWLNKKVKETEAITSFDAEDIAFPISDSATKTLRFKQKNVHDFAWFCDKRYHVLKGEIETPHTKHKVTTWVMFTGTAGNLWRNSISYVNDAIYYYSLWNGDYPYNNCTAVDGTISAGSGMEYPNITVIGSAATANMLDVVITHEVGHNWFYGMLGSNERIHPWMDEGMNSYNELRYVETKYPDKQLIGRFAKNGVGKTFDLNQYKQKVQYELGYLFPAKKNEDQPIETPAYDYIELNYAGIVYCKTAIVFDYLKAYIGEKEMDKAMQRYFDEWHFKHPQPGDFRKVLEQSTGKNLSWFFDDLINTTRKLDYKITFCSKNENGSWDLEVKNTGEISGPLFIQGLKDKKVVETVIYEGFEGRQGLNFPAADVDCFKIDYNEKMPEINRKNNSIHAEGIFKKAKPLKLQFLGSLDNPDKAQLFFTPVVGWNNYNKWMLGFAFYNSFALQKKFEFQLMPMFSYSKNDIAGYGKVTYNIFPEETAIQRFSLGVTATRYLYSNESPNRNFNKIAPELTIEFKKSFARSKVKNSISYRNIAVFDFNNHVFDMTTSTSTSPSTEVLHRYNDIKWQLTKKDVVQPFNLLLNFQEGGQRERYSGIAIDEMSKVSLTTDYSYKFKEKNKSFDLRFFAGTFIGTDAVDAAPYRFRLSGKRGDQDYLYDNIFLGRSETSGVLASQFTETDGGFKFYSTVGQTAQWLTALNVKSSLGNLKLPLKLYADVGTAANDGLLKQRLLYNAGVCISFSNIFEIYFPLLLSTDLQNYKDVNNLKYAETIRFTLNLNLINPFDLVKSI